MKPGVLICLALASCVCLTTAHRNAAAESDLQGKLRELKAVCDQGLLSESECAKSRAAIVERFTTGPKNDDRQEVGDSCNYADGSVAITSFEDSVAFSPSANALQIVKEILDEAGLAQNFVVREGRVANAAAVVSGYDRFVLYNPDFLSHIKGVSGTNWAVYSVMAHEIAHHLQGHTLRPGGSRPPTELQADNYSGFILAKLGASLDQAQIAMSKFGSDQGSATHPPRQQRLNAIAAGWQKARSVTGPIVSAPPAPHPKPTRDPEPEPEPRCEDECRRSGERECVDELEEQVCRRNSEGCLEWQTKICDGDDECRDGRCRRPIIKNPPPGGGPLYCCDLFGNRRCVQAVNPAPVGAPCFCFGQGTGVSCD